MIEVVIVLSVGALLMAIGARSFRDSTQKTSARAARVAVAQNIALARSTAVARGCRAAFNVDTLTGMSWVTACQTGLNASPTSLDTIGLIDNTERRFGVSIFTATPQIVYDPRGLSLAGAAASYRFQGCMKHLAQTVCNPNAVDSFYVNAIGKVSR